MLKNKHGPTIVVRRGSLRRERAGGSQQAAAREFRAGRYFPACWGLKFSLGEGATAGDSATAGEGTTAGEGPRLRRRRATRVPAHASIDEARNEAAEEGTKSILDVDRISETADWGAASPVDDDV